MYEGGGEGVAFSGKWRANKRGMALRVAAYKQRAAARRAACQNLRACIM